MSCKVNRGAAPLSTRVTLRAVRKVLTLASAAFVLTASFSSAELIVRGGAARYTADIAEALIKEARTHGVEARSVEITGRFGTDQSRVSRLAQGEQIFFALGPHATALAGVVVEASGKGRVISLAVPNPERVQTPARYVAFYPRPEPALKWLGARFDARTFGFVYTPGQNAAIAATFEAAAKAQGMKLRAIPAASSGELVRGLKGARAEVDVLLFPVDPLLFDRESVQIVVEEARAARKPLLGFLPDVPQLGFTAALVNSPEALAKAAWQLSRVPAGAAEGVQEVDGPMLFVTKEGTTTVDLAKAGGR